MQIADLLLESGADVNAQDWTGQTPLHWAAYEGTVETVQLLLDCGADTTIRNKEGLRYDNLVSSDGGRRRSAYFVLGGGNREREKIGREREREEVGRERRRRVRERVKKKS